jgi:hypothetical protein
VRQFLPHLEQQLPEGCAVIDDPTLQGPIAQPQLARHGRYLRPASRKQAFENPFHLLTDRTLRAALFKRAFGVIGDFNGLGFRLVGRTR